MRYSIATSSNFAVYTRQPLVCNTHRFRVGQAICDRKDWAASSSPRACTSRYGNADHTRDEKIKSASQLGASPHPLPPNHTVNTSATSSIPVPSLTSIPEPVLTATGGEEQAKYSRFNIKYYRSYFDVDTSVCGWCWWCWWLVHI